MRSNMDTKQKCKQCGKEFTLTESEKDFYISKGLQLPKRCKDCREQNKQGKNAVRSSENTPTANNLAELMKKPGGAAAVIITLIVMAVLAVFLLPEFPGYDDSETFSESTYSQASEAVFEPESSATEPQQKHYSFRNNDRLLEHYEKHGIEMGFASAEEYEQAANDVINNPASITKREAEDNDYVYYLEATEEFVIVSTDGYIRTYYYASLDYYNRQ